MAAEVRLRVSSRSSSGGRHRVGGRGGRGMGLVKGRMVIRWFAYACERQRDVWGRPTWWRTSAVSRECIEKLVVPTRFLVHTCEIEKKSSLYGHHH